MSFQASHPNLSVGVLGGTFLSAITHIGSEDIITTIVLATLGAIVSFIASIMMKHFVKTIKKQRKK
ncbi:hypothetical protein SAMN04487762_0948 [Polaribacter sp. Hel1_33_78]|uniref:hypothetical protein n=1 Tax=Polaribacter sp. Hel1_33_78 TaxID=1336804 RepID=UPI00087A6B18|nr:hypothetical protein [Polaribacter sp. Hel1_33_78]SDT96456.1 hypothetical protein SAMN04487762_0948 [Polaribacter sp. Hel1_33_78]